MATNIDRKKERKIVLLSSVYNNIHSILYSNYSAFSDEFDVATFKITKPDIDAIIDIIYEIIYEKELFDFEFIIKMKKLIHDLQSDNITDADKYKTINKSLSEIYNEYELEIHKECTNAAN